MKVSTEKAENRQVVLEVEADPEEVERSLGSAYRRLVQRAQIPGFRKGKAPREMLERHLGRETLLQEALERLVPQLLNQAIDEQGIEPIAQPEVEITQIDPVIFKATVPLSPTIELGNYQDISIHRESVEVTEEEINRVIAQLQSHQGTWEPVERPVQFGDLVTINVVGNVGGENVIDRNDLQFQVIEGMPVPVPGFTEELVGIEVGKEKEFTISTPADYGAKELAGKDCLFKIKIIDIKEQKLPELGDEFAKSLGQGFKTFDDLKQDVSSHLQVMAEDGARRAYENKIIDALVEASKVEFPPVMVEKEIDRLITAQESELQASRISLEDYLRSQKKGREELREELRPIASKQIAGSLVLSKLADEEKITVSDEEVDEEIGTMAQNAGEQGENMVKLFKSAGARKSLEGVLVTRKTVKRLVEIASGEALADVSKKKPEPIQDEVTAVEGEAGPSGSESASADNESKDVDTETA
jgi:trigger factor